MRIIFAGTPDFSVTALKALYTHHEIIGVLTQPDRPAGRGKKPQASAVKQYATSINIKILQPETLQDFSAQIQGMQADVMIVVAYGLIIPKSILSLPKYGCINIHASLLPRWRGAAPIHRAIEQGDEITGISIMQMDSGLDTGDIYQRYPTPISEEDTSESLHLTLSQLGARAIIEVLAKLQNDSAPSLTTQDNTQANYAKKITKKEAQINWDQPSLNISRKIRAFTPWPICYTTYNQTVIRIWQAHIYIDKKYPNENAGTIVDITNTALIIKTQDSALAITRLQQPGGKPLLTKHFIRGFDFKVGGRCSS